MSDPFFTDEPIDRPPRIQPPLPIQEIEIPPPPDKQERQPLIRMLFPFITIVGYVLVSAAGRGRNLLFILPMGLSIVATSLFALYSYVKEGRRVEKLRKAYDRRLLNLRKEMQSYHDMQRRFFLHNFPDIETTLNLVKEEEHSRIGPRLWERRPQDADFGAIRIGIGETASTVIYTVSTGAGNQEDPQMAEAIQLAEDSRVVAEVPIPIPLRPVPPLVAASAEADQWLPARHSVGISGPTSWVSNYMRAIAAQFTAFHSPRDAYLFVIGAPHAKSRWKWAEWLPHTNFQSKRYEGGRMCFDLPLEDPEDPKDRRTWDRNRRAHPDAFWETIKKELENRRLRLEDERESRDVTLPFLLIVVDNLPPLETEARGQSATLWLDDVVDEAAVATILAEGDRLGAAIIFLVTSSAKIPSDCRAVVEVQVEGAKITLRYSEVGVNTPRYVGSADMVGVEHAEEFAQALKDLTVRMGYGADLVNALSILELHNVKAIEELEIAQYWQESRQAEAADWMRVALGVMGGNAPLELYFHQDYDGVHGMIAGTTGSGKSELLLTLICGLALRYDPSIINFVLVDYKGGAAFEPFRHLPHCVDMVTNLDGHAVERMFIAIKAELDRRSELLAQTGVKHIVEYRKRGLHLEREPFPHLFIVVDEFAEMIQENAEYKSRFDSITRLGRAIGVSLILATQRPTGKVSDQMRANMKFRICLRVETADDSRELLGRSDAVFLPSNIPGRAYLQVGNESLKLAQIARAGGPFVTAKEELTDDIIYDETRQFSSADDLPRETGEAGVDDTDAFAEKKIEPETIVDRIVAEMIDLAKRDESVLPQHKPWPDPLPPILPLNRYIDAKYLTTTREVNANQQLYLSREVATWMKRERPPKSWLEGHCVEWDKKPLRVDMGLIDIPSRAEQRLLSIDLTIGPLLLFGAGGWGKTTFLRTLMIALAAAHSPRELLMYALDFGRGGLSAVVDLPHLARPIDVTEEARVHRLLRILGNLIEERADMVREHGTLPDYNQAHPEKLLPAVLVVIDNFAEFRDNYEPQITQLVSIIRAGRSMGIYFVVTADQTGALPGKLFSLFTQRLTLKLADTAEYQSVVGRGISTFTETPGRGLITLERAPREFQVAVPVEFDPNGNPIDLADTYRQLARKMMTLWDKNLGAPQVVEPLPAQIQLVSLLPKTMGTETVEGACVIGMRDLDRGPLILDIVNRGPHCLVAGPPLSGKTTALRAWTLATAHSHSPEKIAIVLIDPRQTLFNYRGQQQLRDLPHVLETISETQEMMRAIKHLQAEYDPAKQEKIRDYVQRHSEEVAAEVFSGPAKPDRHLVIVIDNYEDFGDFDSAREIIGALADMARRYRDQGLHFILCGSPDMLRNRDDLFRRIENSRYALVLQSADLLSHLGGRVTHSLAQEDLPPGRCFLVRAGQTQLAQIALTHDERLGNLAAALDARVSASQTHFQGHKARWHYQGSLELFDAAMSEKPESQRETATATPPETPKFSDEVEREREAMLKRFESRNKS